MLYQINVMGEMLHLEFVKIKHTYLRQQSFIFRV